ncbi:hypothetical protein BDP55DRAFT_670011 [Colletotrichum godetiae]|uniref:Uncharacterized protein n=1 Tax=Colletotrichum godetiae TaxID=1209918 RepID=A0AAJ0EVL7_9PEZI|nr:uncharacterized protein BDP55DRAFT_670011 [Colletotrichum godetiae]KAK1673359.1 hypothetical protein BDP55DRAFT_670011 [Colletotrichum godetiae]
MIALPVLKFSAVSFKALVKLSNKLPSMIMVTQYSAWHTKVLTDSAVLNVTVASNSMRANNSI